ncbi:unnamed protein product [Allacma fusca]|uniref:Uncharacterized protein n=1 Tax=Allacma fusca TaxID=39272 RepID=A0A8J2KID1_9HEXA|nr:unnamed protein product [Allacma fusca]
METEGASSSTDESIEIKETNNYLESLAQPRNNSQRHEPARENLKPAFSLCAPTLSSDELNYTRKKKVKNKNQNVRKSCSDSESNLSNKRRRSKRRRSRSKKISRSKSSSWKRKKRKKMRKCRNKMCVKHAKNRSIPNLLSDSPCGNKNCIKHAKNWSNSNLGSPCENKRCAKHATSSIPKFEEDVCSNSNENNDGKKSPRRKRSRCNTARRSKSRSKNRTKESQSDRQSGSDSSCSSESSLEEEESTCTSEEDSESHQNCSLPAGRGRKPKTIINRILEFLGLQRGRSSGTEERVTAKPKCPTCGGKLRNTGQLSQRKRAYISTEGVTNCSKVTDCQNNDMDGLTASQSNECHNNECKCFYCPLKMSGKLDLDNIMVTPECGNLISKAIRDMLYKEIESRLEGLEDHIVEEERQFWATYIPRDKCPRCCSSQQCDLHGSLGCVACFSHAHAKKF